MMTLQLILFMVLMLNVEASVNIYDPDTEICCNGTVHTWKAGWRCCGTQSYNPKNHICCFGKLMTLPGNGIYGCCGEPQQPTLFQYGQHDCCHGQVVELSHLNTYYGCCRTKVYYPEKELCCNGHVKPQVGNLTCCGEEMIDENEQLCCQKLTKVNGSIRTLTAVHPLRGNHSTCCGLNPIDWKQEMCCGDAIHPRNHTIWCCGGKTLYDAATHVCCKGKILQKEKGKECCWTAGKLYDSTTHFCCHSELLPLEEMPTNKSACCTMNHHKVLHSDIF